MDYVTATSCTKPRQALTLERSPAWIMNSQLKPDAVSPAPVVRPTQPALAAHRPAVSGGDAHRLPSPSPAASPARFDVASSKGMFGWATLEGNSSIPYLMRNDGKYVSVRMVERKLLSRYPRVYPPELRDRPALISQYASETEAVLLNEINVKHCECAYGRDQFRAGSDLLVRLADFEEFYKLVRRNFPERAAAFENDLVNQVDGGWIQVNNTVVPFVVRATERLAPLSVLQHAAGLLTGVQVPTSIQTKEEHDQLNTNCRQAGLQFEFASGTRLVCLTDVQQLCPDVVIAELSTTDPFGSANYQQLSPGATLPPLQQYAMQSPPPVSQLSFGQSNYSALSSALEAPLQNSTMPVPQNITSQTSAPTYYRGALQQQSPPISTTSAMASVASNLAATRIQHGQVSAPRMATPELGSPQLSSQLAYSYALNSRAQLPALPQASPNVQPVNFRRERIACLYRDVAGKAECFALMEALARVYFPQANMTALADTLQGVLGVPLHDLTSQEEVAFIRFYSLRSSTLRYRKVVMLRLFDFYFPQLHYIFNGANTTPQSGQKRSLPSPGAPSPPAPPVVVKQEVTSAEVTPIVVEPVQRKKRRRDNGEVICLD